MILVISNRNGANIRTQATLCLLAMLVTAVPVAADNQRQILSISTGHSLILRGQSITKIAVGDGRIATAVPLDRERVLINPKGAGDTSIFLWDASGQHTYELTVTDDRLDRIAGLLRTSLDSPDVTVTALGSTIFVNGKVSDIAEYQRIDASIAKFKDIKFEGTAVTVVDGTEIAKPLGALQDRIAAIPDASNLRVDMAPTGDVVVSGRVRDRQQAQGVLDQVGGLAGPYLKADGKVVDRLAVDVKSQVDVKVDVFEVDHTASSTLGMRLQTAQQSSVGGQFTVGTTQSITALESPNIANGNNPFQVGPFARVSLLAPTLDLLMQEGHAKSLYSPNLVTMPGKAATFLVGGEIPIPISNGLGTVTIQYEEYGVKFSVTPTINADGSIESLIAPEISDLDFADGVTLNGYTVPAFKTSKISTDVITQTGESIVMGGLLSRVESKSIQKVPLLGDIPILGTLFRDVTYSKTDMDVVFVLTPTILTRTAPIQAPSGGMRRVMPPIRFVPVSQDATPQPHAHAKRDSIPSPAPTASSP